MSVFSYEWVGRPHASESIKTVNGVEVARNLAVNPAIVNLTGCQAVTSQAELIHTGSAARWTFLGGSAGVNLGAMTRTTVGEPFALRMRARANRHLEGRVRVGGAYGDSIEMSTDWVWYSTSSISTSTAVNGVGLVFAWTQVEADDWVEVDRVVIATADTEADALAQVETYFDGDTETHSDSAFKVRRDGLWHLVPTLVCEGGKFQHASVKKYKEDRFIRP